MSVCVPRTGTQTSLSIRPKTCWRRRSERGAAIVHACAPSPSQRTIAIQATTMPPTDSVFPTKVWDLPTRVFHWFLVVLVVLLVVFAQVGAMEWHFRCGYALSTLVLFRVLWGFWGGHWSRFAQFTPAPKDVAQYLRGTSGPRWQVGHNPLGALSVFGLLALLALQVATGLCSDDEISSSGPLSRHVSSTWVQYATFYHAKVGKLLLLAAVGMHIGAVLFYRFFKGHNLVSPMFSGLKELPWQAPQSADGAGQRLLALGLWLLCTGAVVALLWWAQ